jgi:hypothetical protein
VATTQAQLIAWIKVKAYIYTQPGVSALLSRHKVKLKTGRQVNVLKVRTGSGVKELLRLTKGYGITQGYYFLFLLPSYLYLLKEKKKIDKGRVKIRLPK